MNYITAITEELEKLEARVTKLRIALEVLMSMKRKENAQPRTQVQKSKRSRRQLGTRGNQYPAVRRHIMGMFSHNPAPTKSKDILTYVMDKMDVGDSTIWKALRDMRDDGELVWDDETRLYSLPTAQPERKVS